MTIVARTNPTLVGGKSCPLAGLEKVATVNGVINWSYENSVNNQRLREGGPTDDSGEVEQFVSAPRAWGRRLHEAFPDRRGNRMLPFVAKQWNSETIESSELERLPLDELYLELKVQKSLACQYFLEGVEQSAETVQPYLRERRESSRQEVENPVILRDYKLSSLVSLTVDGNTYEL